MRMCYCGLPEDKLEVLSFRWMFMPLASAEHVYVFKFPLNFNKTWSNDTKLNDSSFVLVCIMLQNTKDKQVNNPDSPKEIFIWKHKISEFLMHVSHPHPVRDRWPLKGNRAPLRHWPPKKHIDLCHWPPKEVTLRMVRPISGPSRLIYLCSGPRPWIVYVIIWW